MAPIPSDGSQVENELTKALLVLNPELLTPKQALEIIYDLRAKAQSKSCWSELSGVDVEKARLAKHWFVLKENKTYHHHSNTCLEIKFLHRLDALRELNRAS